ncbi:MAG: polysaccharide biosynthesis C-terminal domain-containing protein [Lachnoclostridium sp.]|nr:polysaccharide biosynthesis C-terminal domain-containing protein [Lachnoclostridium sp.]
MDQLTLIAMVLNLFFSICMRPVWTFREGTGMYRQIRYVMFGTAVLNLVLSIVMGYWLGISGILFATSISKFATYFWYEPYLLYKNFFDSNVANYYLKYLRNAGLILLGGIICYLPISMLKTVSLFNWVVKAVICFVVVNGLYFVAFRKTESFYFLKDKAMALVRALKRR